MKGVKVTTNSNGDAFLIVEGQVSYDKRGRSYIAVPISDYSKWGKFASVLFWKICGGSSD